MNWLDKAKVTTAAEKSAAIQAKLVEEADAFVAAEIVAVRHRIEEIQDGDQRARGTEQLWRQYRKDLKNYVQEIDGKRQIMADPPTRPA